MANFLNLEGLTLFKQKLDALFATKTELSGKHPLIDADNKLSHTLVSGLGTAATQDSTAFATAAQGLKADAAIPNPSNKSEGNFLKWNGSAWVAADVPDTGVLSLTAGDDTVVIGGTSANPTVKVASGKFDADGAAAAVQGSTTKTVKDAVDDAATAKAAADAAQATADAAVVANAAIAAGTKAKISYDAKGLVTGGSDLEASDIPALPTSKITSGTFADERIASAAIWNAKQDALAFTGSYDADNNKVVLADYVADAVALAANGGREVVTELPEATEANYKKKMIYLYKPEGATSYEEYIIAKNGNNYVREKLGDTDIKLTNYWAKADLTAITNAEIIALFA